VGFFWQGLPPYLIPWATEFLPSPVVAVETGTFQGDTSQLLADKFGACVTIERSPTLAADAEKRFAETSKVTVLTGSSRDRLLEALPEPAVSCFFWLDAHGVYDYVGSDPEENPLLFELETILGSRGSAFNVIVIDDARGMGVQPDWPPLTEILGVLQRYDYTASIIDDVLVAAPIAAKPDFYALYKSSRMVEVSAVFHLWPQIMRSSRFRAATDAAITAVRGRFNRG
jgi:hypothetical protein